MVHLCVGFKPVWCYVPSRTTGVRPWRTRMSTGGWEGEPVAAVRGGAADRPVTWGVRGGGTWFGRWAMPSIAGRCSWALRSVHEM
ncbi:hypothetical protein Skr01_20120 [Sphaerisporangium krabiense]|nr:hypothetical protein Skr01_20120 [Sphaerisporangium krabiense]